MPTNLDETELARIGALACAAGAGDYSVHDDADASAKFAAAACNAVPALVAEVRRLREDRTAMLRDMDAVKTKAEPCDDCWTIYMLMREMGIEEKNWFHRDVCARLTEMQNAEKENAALREKVEAWEKEKPHLEETARVLAEQVGKGNLGKIQKALEWAEEEAKKREAVHADRE